MQTRMQNVFFISHETDVKQFIDVGMF